MTEQLKQHFAIAVCAIVCLVTVFCVNIGYSQENEQAVSHFTIRLLRYWPNAA